MQAGADAAELAAAAGEIASLVDLPVDDVSSLLLPASGHGQPGDDGGAVAIDAAAQQAWAAVQQLEGSSGGGDSGRGIAALRAAVEQLGSQCSAAAVVLVQRCDGSGGFLVL